MPNETETMADQLTKPFLEKIQPEPVSSREAELEAANAALLRRIDDATAKILTLEADVAMALDALREIGAGASCTVNAIEGEPV